MNEIDGVKVSHVLQHQDRVIRCINVCDLQRHLYGDTAFRGWHPDVNRSYEQETADVMSWALAHKASFYAAPREDFNLYDATEHAYNEGHDLVITEDMS